MNKTGNVLTCLHNCLCLGTAVSITYSECVSVALVVQHAMHMGHIVRIVICDLSGFTTFDDIL
jgi:hypothetical protein